MTRDLTHERLVECVDYDPATGEFIWKRRPERTAYDKMVNVQRAGKKAGSRSKRGYVKLTIDGEPYQAHRLAWLFVHGSWPSNQIDHANCNRSDNRIENLREATIAQNQANTRTRSKTGFKGVSVARSGRFTAMVRANGRTEYIGIYDTPEAANAAYEQRAVELFGQFARAA